MNILLVEDDEPSRYLMTAILQSANHEVVPVCNGVEALDATRSHSFDLLITDILMPKMDGFQLVWRWKNDPTLANVPVVFVTASYTDDEDEKFAIELGADGFLNKPIDIERLLTTVEAVARISSTGKVCAPIQRDEARILRAYSDRIVCKLEQKLAELERSNMIIDQTTRELSDQIAVKSRLVDSLTHETDKGLAKAEELQKALDFNKLIIDTAEVFICSTDSAGRITLFSPGAERISGYTADEVLGKCASEIFSPPDQVKARRLVDEAIMADGLSVSYAEAWVMNSGVMKILRWSASVIKDASGSPAGIVRFGIDVTEQLYARGAERVMGVLDASILQNSPISEMLQLASDQIAHEFKMGSVLIMLFDQECGLELAAVTGRFSLKVATKTLLDTGCMRLADDGTPPVAFVVDLCDSQARSKWKALAQDPDVKSAVFCPIKAEDRMRGCLVALSGFNETASDTKIQSLGTVTDRVGTALVFAETREKVLLQSAALDWAGNAIIITDAYGKIRWVNTVHREMTGYFASEVIGKELFSADQGYAESGYRDVWNSVVGGKRWQGELLNKDRSGREYLESVTISPVFDSAGKVTSVVIVKSDASKSLKFERLKSDFVSMVSHELRTPLTKIIGYSDILESKMDASHEQYATAVGAIKQNAAVMRHMIEKLLSVTQLMAGLGDLKSQPVDICRLVEQAAMAAAAESGRRVEVALPAEACELDVDPEFIGRALGNLLDNALKYSPEDSTVSVVVERAGSCMSISVADEGIGIDEDRLEEIFEPFIQVDMSSTRGYGGIGLGLFVARRLIEAHGGEINVCQRAEGGSIFDIRLPLGKYL